MSDDRVKQLPLQVARQILTHQVDLESELRALLNDGQRRITIGLGHGVDVPLLPAELEASDVSLIDRDLVIGIVRAEPGAYTVERGHSNFGLFTMNRTERTWQSVPFMSETRGLLPGDKIALGSTPAEAIQFRLPDCALVSRPRPRSRRHAALRDQEAARAGTPLAAPDRTLETPTRAERASTGAPTPRRGPMPGSRRYERAFEVALRHWRYDMITFGGDEGAVLALDDPALTDLRAAIGRDPDQPGRGYDLFVKVPMPDLWAAPAGQGPTPLTPGAIVRLKGPGNQIGFGRYVVGLPAPTMPTARFSANQLPDRVDIAEVLSLSLAQLADPALTRARYLELVRRFHPDRNGGDPGHLSRFHEVQLCWDALDWSGA